MIASQNRVSPCFPSRRAIAGLVMAWAGTSAASGPLAQHAYSGRVNAGVTAQSTVRDLGSITVGKQTALAVATVSNCADKGPGSLREAVATHAAVIDMTSLACSTISLTTGQIVVDPSVPSVSFYGPIDHVLTIDANHNSRIILHNSDGTLTLDHLKLTNGSFVYQYGAGGACAYTLGSAKLQNATLSNCSVSGGIGFGLGGAIYVSKDLTLNDSVLSGNTALSSGSRALGGAAFVPGKLVMNHSAIRDNTAFSTSSEGGGVYVRGEAQIYSATISGNLATYEGGLTVIANATIGNSTISGNSASVVGGLYVSGSLLLDNSTIAFNTNTSDAVAAGVYATAGVVAHSSIVADNYCTTSGQHCELECKNCMVIGANNLIMAANVALPADTIVLDPMLAPLADNGGLGGTHALLAGSPARDKGSNIHDFLLDQRGRPRKTGTAPDVGAFEAEGDPIFADGFD